jgi:hypothetical protein
MKKYFIKTKKFNETKLIKSIPRVKELNLHTNSILVVNKKENKKIIPKSKEPFINSFL